MDGTNAGDDDLLAELARWASGQRVADAAGGRARERRLRRLAEEEADLAGLALDLLEARAEVQVRTTAGGTHSGRVLAVGADFLALATAGGGTALIAFRGTAWLRARERGAVPASRRDPMLRTSTLAHVLGGLAGERRRVRWSIAGDPDPGRGELVAMGVDVLTLAPDGAPTPIYVPVANLAELTVLGLG